MAYVVVQCSITSYEIMSLKDGRHIESYCIYMFVALTKIVAWLCDIYFYVCHMLRNVSNHTIVCDL